MTIPSSASSNMDNVIPSIPSSISVSALIAEGRPFVRTPKFSILDMKQDISGHSSFGEWLSIKLQAGQPFIIEDFDKLPEWDKSLFSIEGLIEHSTKKNIPIRNCTTSRDLSFTLKKFAEAACQSYREFRNFYARDLHCPKAWADQCSKLLPPELQYAGRADLFQWLPACARSEVMLAYVGSRGSTSGFHRCFSSTVALNLLVELSDSPVVCFGTDFESQVKYDAFMAARGASPHVDWLNLSPDELKKADFPIYVCEQKVGDLVVFPPATAHQVWNMGSLSTKIVWNILHPLSLEAGLNYVQPPFNRLCHPDVARTNLSLACAMLNLTREDASQSPPPDLPLLTRLFQQMVQDESIEDTPATPVTLVQIPISMIATCDFCGTAIWNRHLRCSECVDFDLCLLCYLNGRSCEHVSSYTWAEIVPQEKCDQVLRRATAILGSPVEDKLNQRGRKSLGTAVNELMKARQSTSNKLCHLCRIEHLEWKGRRCDTCCAFFCFRGLYRHFDMYATDVMRHSGLWVCPKCSETCNCRCCHFPSAYIKAEKPISKRRVKPADPRGKMMGFTDNVFDQKKRNVSVRSPTSSTYQSTPMQEPRGQKRSSSVLSVLEPPLSAASRTILPQSNTTSTSIARASAPNHDPRNAKPPTRDDSAPCTIIDQPSHEQSHQLLLQAPPPRKFQNLLHPPSPTIPPSTAITSTMNNNPLAKVAGSQSYRSHPVDDPGGPSRTIPFPEIPQLQSCNEPPSSNAPDLLPPTSTTTTTTTLAALESKLSRLRHYASELLSLSFQDSHRLLDQEIRALEQQIKSIKQHRSKKLLDDLEREFPGLIGLRHGIREEAERLGYF